MRNVRDTVRCLVDRYGYLPFATEDVLRHAFFVCDLEFLRINALFYLTSRDPQAELYRQAVYSLAVHGFLDGTDLYTLAQVGRAAMDSIIGAREVLANLKVTSRDKARMLAVLALTNFAIVPPILYNIYTGVIGRRHAHPVALPTISTLALAIRTPVRTSDRSPVPEDIAELIVEFGFELRRSIVEWILKHRPRTAGDIIPPVYTKMAKELEKQEWGEARDYRDFIKGPLQAYILREALLAPYYLHHYGYLELDPVTYTVMWKLWD